MLLSSAQGDSPLVETIRTVIIAGWAQTEESLARLAASFYGEIASVYSLLRSERPQDHSPDAPSIYARALAARLAGKPSGATLVGWSMGGMVALETAIHFPVLVRQLILISTSAKFCSAPGYPHGVSPAVLRAMMQGLHRDRRETLERFFALVYSNDGSAEQRAEDLRQSLQLDLECLVHGLQYLRSVDLRSRLADVRVPVLIVHGGKDQVISWQAGRLLHEGISGSELLLLDEADHSLPVTAPELLASRMARFLGTESRPAGGRGAT
jgi:pimeloyl-[acyl-carrier protein] methyl ester esterase